MLHLQGDTLLSQMMLGLYLKYHGHEGRPPLSLAHEVKKSRPNPVQQKRRIHVRYGLIFPTSTPSYAPLWPRLLRVVPYQGLWKLPCNTPSCGTNEFSYWTL